MDVAGTRPRPDVFATRRPGRTPVGALRSSPSTDKVHASSILRKIVLRIRSWENDSFSRQVNGSHQGVVLADRDRGCGRRPLRLGGGTRGGQPPGEPLRQGRPEDGGDDQEHYDRVQDGLTDKTLAGRVLHVKGDQSRGQGRGHVRRFAD